MNEFHNNGFINFNFWSIDEQLSNDSVGSSTFFISELATSKQSEAEYFDERS